MDLDNFSKVNDHRGHEAGNLVLKEAARELLAVVRTTDFAARYGGDEFVVLLVPTGADGARMVADKRRARGGGDGKIARLPREAGDGEHRSGGLPAAGRSRRGHHGGGRPGAVSRQGVGPQPSGDRRELT